MEALIVLERLGGQGELIERQRHRLVAGQTLRIGRGWDAEVHLDDPHVALHHATLHCDEQGGVELQAEGSLNGVINLGDGQRVQRVRLGHSLDLRLGHTRLRLLDGRVAQPAERPLPQGVAGVSWWEALAWWMASLGLSLALDWAGQVGEIRSSALLIGTLVGGVVMMAWAFGWSLVTRLFAGEMRFLRHLRVVALGSLAASAVMLGVQYGSYALAIEPLVRFSYVGYWLLFAVVCWRHLKVMGAGHGPAKAWAMFGIAVVAIGLQSLSLGQPRGGEQRAPRYVRNVVPPMFRLRPVETVDSFLARAGALEAGLIEARSEDDSAEEDPGADFGDEAP